MTSNKIQLALDPNRPRVRIGGADVVPAVERARSIELRSEAAPRVVIGGAEIVPVVERSRSVALRSGGVAMAPAMSRAR